MSFTIATHKSGHSSPPSVASSKLYRWLADERPHLFPCIEYGDPGELRPLGLLPKTAGPLGAAVLTKILGQRDEIRNFIVPAPGRVCLYHRIARHFVKSFAEAPYFWNEREGRKKSEDYKELTLASDEVVSTIRSLLVSSTFYSFYVALSDSYHCGRETVLSFPTGLSTIPPELRKRIERLGETYDVDLRRNSQRRRIQYKSTGWIEYDEFYPRLSKQILDAIDAELASHYGFTPDELEFITNYDIKYRMGLTGDG
jgi:hypothetical protein